MEGANNSDTVKLIVQELEKFQVDIVLQENNYEQLLKGLSQKINLLITNDFSRLISILYRLDISEKKLSYQLAQLKGTNAGDIIANLIVERQLQKIKSRQALRTSADIPEEEKW